jgi:hypothetical protein
MSSMQKPIHPLSTVLALLLGIGGLWLLHGAPGGDRLDPRVQRHAGDAVLHAGRGVRAVAAAVTAHYLVPGQGASRR